MLQKGSCSRAALHIALLPYCTARDTRDTSTGGREQFKSLLQLPFLTCSAMHDPETSPVGRLDEYIRSFEAKYGAVPVEIQTHELQSSLGSIVEPVAIQPSPERQSDPRHSDPPEGLSTLASPAREFFSLPASITTPRYPWQVGPSEPVRALPFNRSNGLEAFVPRAQNRLSSKYKVPSLSGSDLLSTACGSSPGWGLAAPGINVPGALEASTHALDISNVERTRLSTPPRFDTSSVFTPIPEVAQHVRQPSCGASFAEPSFCSLAARSSFSTDTVLSSSNPRFAPRAEPPARGSAGLAPCPRVERARGASSAPRLQLAGPSGRHQANSDANASRKLAPSSYIQSHLPGGSGLRPGSGNEIWAPLPAPRGPAPKVWPQRPSSAGDESSRGLPPRKVGSESVELSGPPQLASPPRRGGSWHPQVQEVAVQFERQYLRSASEAFDEVNCQSPTAGQAAARLLLPRAGAVIRSCEMAVQTDSIPMVAASSTGLGDSKDDPLSSARLPQPRAGVQADSHPATRSDDERGKPSMWRSPTYPEQDGSSRRDMAEEVFRSQESVAGLGAVCTPEKPRVPTNKEDTPDFGDMVSAQASNLCGSFEASRSVPLHTTSSVQRGDAMVPRPN